MKYNTYIIKDIVMFLQLPADSTSGGILNLISSFGSAGAAVFVCWFLVKSFTASLKDVLTQHQEQNQNARKEFLLQLQEQHNELMILAKDKGDIIRANISAITRMDEEMSILRQLIQSIYDKMIK